MAWTDSSVMGSFLEDAFNNDVAFALDTDAIKAALFNDSVTPDDDATAANNTYGSGTWTTANEVDDGTNWDAGGEPLTSLSATFGSNTFTFDAADTPQGGTSTTLSNAFGCLVHDSTVSNAGICFNYFGGTQSVTSGDFTIQWHANGIFTVAY